MDRKRIVKYFELAVSVGITLGFIYLFYVVIGFDRLIYFFKKVDPVNILSALTLYISSYITRALRWQITLSIKDFKKLFKITAFNTVFNIFLPFRTGELSFFYMLKKENIPFSETAVSFVAVRIFDGVSLLTVSIFAFLWLKGLLPLGILVVLVAPGGIFILRALARFIKHSKIQEFSTETLTVKNVLALYILSILTFFLKFTAFSIVLPPEVGLSFKQTFFASSIGDLTTILPIHGIAGIGTYEMGFAGVLIFLGVDKETALLSSVFVHIFMLLGAVITAGISLLFFRR
ncbi:MAG: flippase-like domain-containing protein [Aquificae bacterium]|nr:flippase-like domain-containing protein [Aquificota bacterium]